MDSTTQVMLVVALAALVLAGGSHLLVRRQG